MNATFKKSALIAAVASVAGLFSAATHAAGTITFGEDKYISVGFGMRGSYSSVEDGAGNGSSRSNDFDLDSARIYISGSLNKYIKGILNTEKDIAGEGFQVIDAAGIFEITPEISIWAGRFLSPSDRANMAGPYYSLGGGYWAGIASRYGFNGGYIGRDDGVALVGTAFDSKLAYSFGAFEGNTAFKIAPVAGLVASPRGSDGLMYAGRLQYSFWDAEPGYYGTGNYLGAKDILTVGVAGRTQNNGAVSATDQGKYSSYSVDFLLEKTGVGPGAVSLEAAYYDYDTDGVFLSEEGKAYSAGAGYIFKEKFGWGQFQPFVRYQKFDADSNVDTKKYDLGVAYIMDGYNAQLSGTYSKTDVSNVSDVDSLVVALQLQF
ncbi:MAG: porin [Nitrosomonadales bacterium]|nr:porin [Nitrosomonadales bacterium]